MTSTRRAFLAAGAAALGGTARAAGRPVRLGGPIYLKNDDPRELAREHRRLGYGAAFCPNVKITDTARIDAIVKGYAAENVIIAEVGAWRNMLDLDPVKRAENQKFVTERMALAEAVGARCCVDIAGSYHDKVWYGPDPRNFSQEFFDATVENCRKVIDAVKPKRAKFTIEMMGWAIPEGPESYLKLLKAVDRAAFGVHIDICNGVNSPQRFYRNAEFIADTFKVLGKWVASCHAKDLKWEVEMNIHFVEVIPGRGSIDYAAYLKQVAALPAETPLMLEHLKSAEEYAEGRTYIQKVAAANGIAFA